MPSSLHHAPPRFCSGIVGENASTSEYTNLLKLIREGNPPTAKNRPHESRCEQSIKLGEKMSRQSGLNLDGSRPETDLKSQSLVARTGIPARCLQRRLGQITLGA